MQEAARGKPGRAILAGSFHLATNRNARTAVLAGGAAAGRIEILFQGVTRSDLPVQLRDITIRELLDEGSQGAERTWEIRSADGTWRIEGSRIQIHEHPKLFGRAIPVHRFSLRKRVIWSLLLWMARYQWGHALIHRATGHHR